MHTNKKKIQSDLNHMALHVDVMDHQEWFCAQKSTLKQKTMYGMETSNTEIDKSHLKPLAHFLYNAVA